MTKYLFIILELLLLIIYNGFCLKTHIHNYKSLQSKLYMNTKLTSKQDISKSSSFLYKTSENRGIYEQKFTYETKPLLNSLLTLELHHLSSNKLEKENSDTSGEHLISSKIIQKTTGPVPRCYLPSVLLLSSEENSIKPSVEDKDVSMLIEACLHWYLDAGGRISSIDIISTPSYHNVLELMGFEKQSITSNNEQISLIKEAISDSKTSVVRNNNNITFDIYKCNVPKFITSCRSRINLSIGQRFVQYDILGRLSHSINQLDDAVKYYTDSLVLKPEASATFRNLGSVYHASGNMQMAFASYQQAIQLDTTDAQVYLKLAYFYEEFAQKDWIDAEVHAQRCYEYYLSNIDPEDISILTRLANLLVRENKSLEAINVYNRILSIDNKLEIAWFNKAHAQIKIKDYQSAIESLKHTIELDPNISAARHMLKALDEHDAVTTKTMDPIYVKELFQTYANSYDSHGKKLLYSAPRVIRQELASIYKTRYTTRGLNGELIIDRQKIQSLKDAQSIEDSIDYDKFDPDECANPLKEKEIKDFVVANASVASSCSTYTSFMNGSLDILDLGCGTGQAGAWLKDYAKTLIGVDISEEMLAVARKKGLYQELYELALLDYFKDIVNSSNTLNTFDVVVAADVFAYIGDLSEIIPKALSVLRSQGLFVFTVESIPIEDQISNPSNFRLLKSGRFGYQKKYIEDIISGFKNKHSVVLSREFSPRLDAGEPAKGYLFIVQND